MLKIGSVLSLSLSLSLVDFAKKCLFAVRLPAVCASSGRRGLQRCLGLGACFPLGSRQGTPVLGRGLKCPGVIFLCITGVFIVILGDRHAPSPAFGDWVSLSHARTGVMMAGAIKALTSKELWGLTLLGAPK